jgi:hypothetical protein
MTSPDRRAACLAHYDDLLSLGYDRAEAARLASLHCDADDQLAERARHLDDLLSQSYDRAEALRLASL